jgi:hypothetical protein
MGRNAVRRSTKHLAAEVPVVGAREPCPCGSGRRYKACHGRADAAVTGAEDARVRRPFEGYAGEADWVALHILVPAATAPLTLLGEHAGTAATLTTVLPSAVPSLRRDGGEVLLALQTLTTAGDVNRDLADGLLRALTAEPGDAVPAALPPAEGPRLEELIDASVPLAVTVHEGFEFWLAPDAEVTPEVSAALEQANGQAHPSARLESVTAAYWTRVRDKAHLRWVMPHDEEQLLDALARLHAAGANGLGEGTRYAGAFRADGLVVPVWDLPRETEADEVEKPAAELESRLRDALAVTTPLTPEERRARAGIVSRQLTLR